MDLGCPVRDWQVRRKCDGGCARKPELRWAAAGTLRILGLCRCVVRLLEVVACELGILEEGEMLRKT